MLRNIDIPGAKEIFAKQDELMVTFWMNKGWVKALNAIHEGVKEDFVKEKMRKLRASTSYDRGAAAYYAKHGTVGEF
jgi:hypothetical protein